MGRVPTRTMGAKILFPWYVRDMSATLVSAHVYQKNSCNKQSSGLFCQKEDALIHWIILQLSIGWRSLFPPPMDSDLSDGKWVGPSENWETINLNKLYNIKIDD